MRIEVKTIPASAETEKAIEEKKAEKKSGKKVTKKGAEKTEE